MGPNENEPILEVTDRRRVSPEGEAAAPPETAAPEAPQEAGDTDAPFEAVPADEETAGELPSMDVYGLLRTTIGLLANGAWAWIGLTPDPFTGEMKKDLTQAKIAIDSVAFLVGQLEPTLTTEERQELRNLVSMLRVNYVQQSAP